MNSKYQPIYNITREITDDALANSEKVRVLTIVDYCIESFGSILISRYLLIATKTKNWM